MTAAWPTADETAIRDIATAWSGGYLVTSAPGVYRAIFRYDTQIVLKATTPEGLESAMKSHWSRTWSGGGDTGRSRPPWDIP